jgi:hypothetical protein
MNLHAFIFDFLLDFHHLIFLSLGLLAGTKIKLIDYRDLPIPADGLGRSRILRLGGSRLIRRLS